MRHIIELLHGVSKKMRGASSSGSYGAFDGSSSPTAYGATAHLYYNAGGDDGQANLDDSLDDFDLGGGCGGGDGGGEGEERERPRGANGGSNKLQSSSSESETSSRLRVTNRTVVACGSMGLVLLTFCTFFLVLTSTRSGVGSWTSSSSTTTTESYSSSDVAVHTTTTTTAIVGGTNSTVTDITDSEEEEDEDEAEALEISFTDDPTKSISAVDWTVSRCNYSTIRFFDGKAASDQLQYAFLSGYAGVLEPYADMELTILLDRSHVGDASAAVTYQYSVADTDGETVAEGTVYQSADDGASDSFSLPCTPKEEFSMTVSRYAGSVLTSTTTNSLMCMYVRREFRSLTDDDLAASLDAMHVMWEYSSSEGKGKYGEAFYSADFFSNIHNYNAGWRDADHIHEGLGFLAQHVKLTNMFEASMQAVDPSVTLFYWDFTVDTKQGLNIYDTPYFSADVFGSITKPSSETIGWSYAYDSLKDARIPDGRWKNLKTEVNEAYPELWNAFGYMRAPWNMNPNQYISRYATTDVNLPGCGNYKEWFEEKDFEASMKMAAYGPHSTTHTAIGGVYGCDVLDSMLADGLINSAADQLEICLKWGFYIKEYYRGNYLTPKSDCSLDSDSCFVCNDDSLNDMKEMMKGSSLSNYLPEDLSEDQWNTWRDFVCNGAAHKIFVGDHLESASPADPSFWPIHPTQERLLQARYANGGFWDFSWPTLGTAGEYVCNHFECYDDETLEFKTSDTACCTGHYEYDRLFYPGDRNTLFGDTNRQVLDDLDASSSKYGMSYIYDSFYWDHCGDSFDVEKLADVLALEALSLTSSGEEIVSSASTEEESDSEEGDTASTSHTKDESITSWGKGVRRD